MSRKICFAIGLIAVLAVTFAVRAHSTAQTKKTSTSSPVPSPLPRQMSLHGHTRNPDDQKHCFVRDSRSAKRPLYFDATVDVSVQYEQVDLALYTFEDGSPKRVTPMSKRQQWDATKPPGKAFTITIKEDTLDSHLGPGPYMAVISITPAGAKASDAAQKFVGYYSYGTWLKAGSPSDCWAH
jgi:hypothetical protein